jgi:hypothetical protein
MAAILAFTVVHRERAGRIHDVHAGRPRVDHDPACRGDGLRRGHVRHHQVAVHVHPEVPRQPDVLDGDVRLGAVGRDPHEVRAQLGGPLELLLGADARLERHREPGPLDHPPGGGQQLVVGVQRAHVLDGGGAEAVAVPHSDGVHAGLVEPSRDQLDLLRRVAVPDAVRAVPQRRVEQPDPLGVRRLAHAVCLSAYRSATRTAADVMMSRFPA